MNLNPMVTSAALLCVVVIAVVWFVYRTINENRRIKQFCLSLYDSICVLREKCNMQTDTMSDTEMRTFESVSRAFNKYIKPNMKYKESLLTAVNSICGKTYSVIDMYDCFENSHKNDFYKDIVCGSGYLFINTVYMSVLEQSGFYIHLNGGTKVQERL